MARQGQHDVAGLAASGEADAFAPPEMQDGGAPRGSMESTEPWYFWIFLLDNFAEMIEEMIVDCWRNCWDSFPHIRFFNGDEE